MKTNSSPLPEVTPTVSVTDWPACSVPCWLDSVSWVDEVSADQLTGPFMAVRVSSPLVPRPRSSRAGFTARLPFALVDADGEAGDDEEARLPGRPVCAGDEVPG